MNTDYLGADGTKYILSTGKEFTLNKEELNEFINSHEETRNLKSDNKNLKESIRLIKDDIAREKEDSKILRDFKIEVEELLLDMNRGMHSDEECIKKIKTILEDMNDY